MIEFKSPCGHTIRARDEDAGKEVRCSYCGQDARVPSDQVDDLDFLFSEAEAASSDTPRAPITSSRARRRGRRTRRNEPYNPLDTVLKLVYLAVAITIVTVVTKMVILPMWRGEWTESDRFGRPARIDESGDDVATQPRAPKPRRMGLIDLPGNEGIYVASFPAPANVYFCNQEDVGDSWRRSTSGRTASGSRRLASHPTCKRVGTNAHIPADGGTYAIEVVMPWNDPRLTRFEGYNEGFRRRIEAAPDPDASDRIMEEYFMPDGASRVFVDVNEDQIYLVKQFFDVVSRPGMWSACHALFVPRDLAIERLVADHLPDQNAYHFDETHVESELAYYEVPPSQRPFMVQALSRVGVWPFIPPATTTEAPKPIRLFKIDIESGQIRVKKLNDGDDRRLGRG